MAFEDVEFELEPVMKIFILVGITTESAFFLTAEIIGSTGVRGVEGSVVGVKVAVVGVVEKPIFPGLFFSGVLNRSKSAEVVTEVVIPVFCALLSLLLPLLLLPSSQKSSLVKLPKLAPFSKTPQEGSPSKPQAS